MTVEVNTVDDIVLKLLIEGGRIWQHRLLELSLAPSYKRIAVKHFFSKFQA